MFANLFMVFIIALMLIPGIYLGTQSMALSPRSFLKIFAFHTIFFAGLGLACKMFPWLIDPRFSLF